MTDPDQQRRSSYIQLFRMAGKAEQVLTRDGGAGLRRVLDGVGDDGSTCTPRRCWSRARSPRPSTGTARW